MQQSNETVTFLPSASSLTPSWPSLGASDVELLEAIDDHELLG
jgi:hypothetical protein